jgi:putative pyruvate formate lyase activating enzyme
MPTEPPAYLRAHRRGVLKEKAARAAAALRACTLCPRMCRTDRLAGELGFCRTGRRAWISGVHPHFGEEAPLVGRNGSGTIFFTHCNLQCRFCQNYEISHLGAGEEVSDEQLAAAMLDLQARGCHNINLVSPSHVVAPILAALELAAAGGLSVPVVYNTGGYDRVETLALLEGVVDIYMPDFKFWDPRVAGEACGAEDYPEVARRALLEMHRQVGELALDDRGIARRGLLVRHLVLPDDLARTDRVLGFIAREISPDTYVNVMSQYRPCHRASDYPPLDRPLTREEFDRALASAERHGLRRLDRRRC